MLNDVIITSLT